VSCVGVSALPWAIISTGASPVDTTPPVLREHEESGLKLGLRVGHTLSRKRRCHSRPQAAGGYWNLM